MIKHGVVMVALLILTLCLLGTVCASEDITASDVGSGLSWGHENTRIEVTESEGLSVNDVEVDHSISFDSDDKVSDTLKSNFRISPDSFGEKSISQYYFVESADSISDDALEGQCVKIDIEDIESIPQGAYESSSEATEYSSDYDYEFGYNATTSANELLDFESLDEILVIVTVSEEVNNVTTENVLNGIYNASNGYITYRKGNLLKLSSIESDLINIAFFVKKGESLNMVFYEYGDLTPSNSDNECPANSVGLWRELEKILLVDDNVESLSIGMSNISALGEMENDFVGWEFGQKLIRTLLEYNLNNDDAGLPLDNAERYIIGVPDDSDDNAFVWLNPDEKVCFSVDSNDMDIGLSMGDNISQSRMITVMSYDKSNYEEIANNNLNPDGNVMIMVETSDVLTPEDIRQIGVDAAKMALTYFKSQGIDVNKYYRNFYILTSAGYVKVNGTDTGDAIKGIIDVLGLKFSKNLISINTPLWKDLVFYFLWVSDTYSDNIVSYGLKYVPATDKLVVSSTVKHQGDKIAKEMGLYGKHKVNPGPGPYPHYNPVYYVVCEDTLGNTTNSTNSTDLNKTVKLKPKETTKKPQTNKSSPYNILYNIGAICMIFIVFGVSYSKR